MAPTDYTVTSGVKRLKTDFGWADPQSYVTINIQPDDISLHLTVPQVQKLVSELEQEAVVAAMTSIQEDR